MKLLIVLILAFSVRLNLTYRILALFPLQAYSHFVMYQRLLKGLAEKGHEVDILSHFPLDKPIPRYTDLSVAGSVPNFVDALNVSILKDWSLKKNFQLDLDHCEIILNTTVVRELKKSTKKYDLVITEIFASDCMVGFVHLFKVPLVSMISSVDLPWGGDRIGNPNNPSYIPNYHVPYTNAMSLIERLVNTAMLIYTKATYHFYSIKKTNDIAREFFGPNLPNIDDLISNTSLILVNSHFSINQARPAVPNFIEVGGLHIGEIKQLPDHILEVLEGDFRGVIYFSMGSMVLTESFEKDKLQGLLDAFSNLPSYKVLWKVNIKKFPPNLVFPRNVHIEKWMPQLDILCHPKVKLFITHGGLMGLQEAIYCGVPLLGIPLFDDQGQNIAHSVAKGFAEKVAYEDITKESILAAAKKLLENPSVEENAKSASNIFKDRPTTALETAIYWVEYVIRHKGAPHLRSRGADLPWYKYYLIDVIAFALTIVLILASAVYLILRSAVNILRILNEAIKIKIKQA